MLKHSPHILMLINVAPCLLLNSAEMQWTKEQKLRKKVKQISAHFDVDQGCSIWPWGRPAFVQLYSDAQGGKRKRKRLSLFFAEKVHLVRVLCIFKERHVGNLGPFNLHYYRQIYALKTLRTWDSCLLYFSALQPVRSLDQTKCP